MMVASAWTCVHTHAHTQTYMARKSHTLLRMHPSMHASYVLALLHGYSECLCLCVCMCVCVCARVHVCVRATYLDWFCV